jgi:hypothetical protein
MSKPHIVQCLCGPARHCIMAYAYETPPESPSFGMSASEKLRVLVDLAIEEHRINPWCSLCRAKREQWVFEDAELKFNSLEEARAHLEESQRQQMLTRRIFEEGKN